MSRSRVTVRSRIPQLGAALQQRASQVVRKTAFDIEADAKPLARRDTGFMADSIQARPVEEGSDVTIYHTGTLAEYGVHNEYGTVNMGPQPFMTPAAEKNRPKFVAAMKQIGKGL